MASHQNTREQFNVPDPNSNFYHTIDLHNHQRTDVETHFHRHHHHHQNNNTSNQTSRRTSRDQSPQPQQNHVTTTDKVNINNNEEHHSKKWQERSDLISAVRKGDVEFVRNFIFEHHFHQPTSDPETDINRYFIHREHHHHLTSHSKQHAIFRKNTTNEDERSCESSDEEELDLAGETESNNTGMNILVIATLAGKSEVVKELLRLIPNIATEAVDSNVSGCTPLLIAAKHHDVETLRVLLEDEKHNPTKKSRVNKAAVCTSKDHFGGFNALMFACHEYGMQASKSLWLKKIAKLLQQKKISVKDLPTLSNKDLMQAQVRTIREILLHAGFDINHESNDERRALYVACGHCPDPRVIEVLVNAGAKFSFAANGLRGATRFDGGSWPIHECIKFARLESLKIILKHIPSAEKRKMEVNLSYGTYNMTPLHLAAGGANSEEESTVIDGGDEERVHLHSDYEEKTSEHEQLLKRKRVTSRRTIYFEIVKLLVENGANVNVHGGLRNELPVEIAKREGHMEIAQFLADHAGGGLIHLDRILGGGGGSGFSVNDEMTSPTQRIEGGGIVSEKSASAFSQHQQQSFVTTKKKAYNSDVSEELRKEVRKNPVYSSDSSDDDEDD